MQNEIDFGIRGASLVAGLAQQRFGGMGQALQPAQVEKAAGALERLDETEDAGDAIGVRRVLLELHDLPLDLVELIVRFRQKIVE